MEPKRFGAFRGVRRRAPRSQIDVLGRALTSALFNPAVATLQQRGDAYRDGRRAESAHACHERRHLSAEPLAALLLLGRQPHGIDIVSDEWRRLRDGDRGFVCSRRAPSFKEGELHIQEGFVSERRLSC